MAIGKKTISISRKTLYELSRTYKSRQDVKISVELIMSLIAISVFGLFAVKPTLVTIGELRTVIEDKKVVSRDLETKIKGLNQAKIIYENEAQRIQLLEIAVPDSPSLGSKIRQIEGIAKKNKMTLTGLSFEDVSLVGETEISEDVPENNMLTFILNASGDYGSLISFWTDIEKMRRPIVNYSASIESPENKDINQLNLTLIGNTPYYKPSDIK